jgi:hypothetical protein
VVGRGKLFSEPFSYLWPRLDQRPLKFRHSAGRHEYSSTNYDTNSFFIAPIRQTLNHSLSIMLRIPPFAQRLDCRHLFYLVDLHLLELVLRSAQIPVLKSLFALSSDKHLVTQQLACSYDTPCWIGLSVASGKHSIATQGTC